MVLHLRSVVQGAFYHRLGRYFTLLVLCTLVRQCEGHYRQTLRLLFAFSFLISRLGPSAQVLLTELISFISDTTCPLWEVVAYQVLSDNDIIDMIVWQSDPE